jgi:hypothetical protein
MPWGMVGIDRRARHGFSLTANSKSADRSRVASFLEDFVMTLKRAKWLSVALLVFAACITGAGARGADPDGSESSTVITEKTAPDLTEIRSRAQSMPIDRRIDIDKRIAATVERTNKQAADKGQRTVAAKLAAQFSTSADLLADEKGRLGWSWGEMMIACTLLSSSEQGVKLSDLATLRSDGLSWGAIAYGLRFRLEDFEDAIKAQGKVAMGLEPDGKAATIEK